MKKAIGSRPRGPRHGRSWPRARRAAQKVAARATAGYSCSKHDHAAVRHPDHRRRRLPRRRAVELGQVRGQDARPALGLKVKLVVGDTPVEQGPAPAQCARAEVRRRPERRSRCSARPRPAPSQRSTKTFYAADIAHISPSATRTDLTQDRCTAARRHAGVLPRRPGRLHPGPDGRELHDQEPAREEGRDHGLPGAVLARSGVVRSTRC